MPLPLHDVGAVHAGIGGFNQDFARLGLGGGRGFGEEGFNAAVAVHIDALHGWGHGVSFLLIGWDGWMEWFSGCLRGA